MQSTTSLLEGWSNLSILTAAGVYAMSFVAYVVDLSGRASRGDERSMKAQGIGHSLLWLAWALSLFGVVLRGISVGRVPWGNMYEFATMGVVAVVGVYLAMLLRKNLQFIGAFVTGFAIFVLLIATIFWYRPGAPLQPALQSYWLLIHVLVAIFGTGFFTVAAGLSILQLVKARKSGPTSGQANDGPTTGGEAATPEGAAQSDYEPVGHLSAGSVQVSEQLAAVATASDAQQTTRFQRLLGSLPSAESLETMAYRTTIIGFVLWTFTLIFGAIWAQKAWGRFWNWDVKEVWTFIVWVIYAGYLHARATRGWRGSPAAWLCLLGFLAVLFNFGVVNVFFHGLHSYSGLNS